MAVKPPVLWAQRKGKLFLKVDVADLKDFKFDLDEEKNTLHVSGKAGSKVYDLALEFFAPVQKEGSVYVVHGKATEMVIMKKESGDHWPRLTKEKTKHPWLQVDWSKYLDQDDEEGKGDKADFDMGGFDPSMMGNFMGGGAGGPDLSALGGMGDMEGFGGEGEDDEGDDDMPPLEDNNPDVVD